MRVLRSVSQILGLHGTPAVSRNRHRAKGGRLHDALIRGGLQHVGLVNGVLKAGRGGLDGALCAPVAQRLVIGDDRGARRDGREARCHEQHGEGDGEGDAAFVAEQLERVSEANRVHS